MKWREWYRKYSEEAGFKTIDWRNMLKRERKRWKKAHPKPFWANIHRDELDKLFAFTDRTSCNVFRIEHQETGIGGVWKVVNLDTKEELDFTCMRNW